MFIILAGLNRRCLLETQHITISRQDVLHVTCMACNSHNPLRTEEEKAVWHLHCFFSFWIWYFISIKLLFTLL